jgi:hypothetical protein
VELPWRDADAINETRRPSTILAMSVPQHTRHDSIHRTSTAAPSIRGQYASRGGLALLYRLQLSAVKEHGKDGSDSGTTAASSAEDSLGLQAIQHLKSTETLGFKL